MEKFFSKIDLVDLDIYFEVERVREGSLLESWICEAK